MLYVALQLLFTALALLVAIGFLLLRHRLNYWQRRGIPHDKPDLFYGNLRGVMERKHFADFFRESYAKFKGTQPEAPLFAGFYMLCQPVVLVLDLDLARQVLIKDFHNFGERGAFYNERDDPLTANIFSLPVAQWRQLRQKFSPNFSVAKLKSMFPSIVAIGDRLVQVIDEQLAEKSVIVLEFKDIYDRFTTDVTGTCIFGLECNSLCDPKTEFRVRNQNLFDNPRNPRWIDGLIYAFPNFARALRLRQIPDVTNEFYFRIVRETLTHRERTKLQSNDLMQMLLQLKQSEALTLDEVVGNAFLFFFAGFETSATTMTLALYELARAPDIQERVRAEIQETLERFDNEYSYDCSQQMPFLEQIIMETLRLHTIIPQLQRKASQSYQTSNAKYHIAKGSLILIPIDAIHHDPHIYPQPYAFQPERFSTDAIKQRHSMSFLPFGEGPRNCIGLSLGKMQIRIGLVSLLRHFRFSLVAESPKKLDYYLQCPFLVPKSNIFLGVERLEANI